VSIRARPERAVVQVRRVAARPSQPARATSTIAFIASRGTLSRVWVGIGATGVALAGIVALGEPVTAARLVFLALIVIGVAGLKLAEA
jgi:hypothetical protein